jgi:hypothetical protein
MNSYLLHAVGRGNPENGDVVCKGIGEFCGSKLYGRGEFGVNIVGVMMLLCMMGSATAEGVVSIFAEILDCRSLLRC